MTLSWLANTDQGYMVGDYVSTSFAGAEAVAAFASGSAPAAGGLLQEAMFASTTPFASMSQLAESGSTRRAPVLSYASDRRSTRPQRAPRR